MKTIAEYDVLVPDWALSELVNSDSSGLTEAEAAQVNNWFSQFVAEAKQAGGNAHFAAGNGGAFFSAYPAFGRLACNVVECKVLILVPELPVNKITPDVLSYIELCANEWPHASVQKLACADVRGLLAERKALVAVAEAASKVCAHLDATAHILPTGMDIEISGAFKQALANLAAVREGKVAQS